MTQITYSEPGSLRKRAFERLEPCEGKLSCTVLRGGTGSDVSLLPEMFCNSVKGADSSAVIYTLVETAKANGIEPYDYLFCLLSLLPGLGKNLSDEQLDELMPWHPVMRKHLARLRSKDE